MVFLLFYVARRSQWSIGLSFVLNGRRAADDLRDLARDRRLAGLVVLQLQAFDELARVVGRGFHRDHLRRHLARDVLDGAAIHLRLDIAVEHAVEQLTPASGS